MSAFFDFSTFPILMTERLRLRQITDSDTQDMIAIFGSPEVLRFLNMSPVDNHDKALDMIGWVKGQFDNHEAVNWGISLRSDDRLIGMCGNYDWDQSNRRVDIGYHIIPPQWGRGYATEATHAIIRWSFDNLDVHRIQADCTDGNLASERVLLKCGFTVEGVWRESCWEHGRFVDIKQFGLLRSEFDANLYDLDKNL